MILNVILWVIGGALTGWIASLIMRTDEAQGGVDNIIIGIVGAFIGGTVARWLGGPGVTGFNFGSLVVAVLGAMLLVFVIRLFNGGRALR